MDGSKVQIDERCAKAMMRARPWPLQRGAVVATPSVYNRGYAASREQAMRYFKARYLGSSN
jgi:hypothetical protein